MKNLIFYHNLFFKEFEKNNISFSIIICVLNYKKKLYNVSNLCQNIYTMAQICELDFLGFKTNKPEKIFFVCLKFSKNLIFSKKEKLFLTIRNKAKKNFFFFLKYKFKLNFFKFEQANAHIF